MSVASLTSLLNTQNVNRGSASVSPAPVVVAVQPKKPKDVATPHESASTTVAEQTTAKGRVNGNKSPLALVAETPGDGTHAEGERTSRMMEDERTSKVCSLVTGAVDPWIPMVSCRLCCAHNPVLGRRQGPELLSRLWICCLPWSKTS